MLNISDTAHGQPHPAGSNPDFEFAALAEARNYRQRLIGEFSPFLKGDVLEVGAGIGQITEDLCRLPGVRSTTAIEPDPRFLDQFRARLPNIPLVPTTTAELPADSEFDALLCINVLEHIREDREELCRHQQLLRRRGGHLCLFVPARQEIYAPIDHDFGHWRRYVKPALQTLLSECGFEIVRLRYFNLIGYFAWWWSFRVRGKRAFAPGDVRFFDRAIFPWVNALERNVLAPPFGQSLLAVARARK